MKIRIGTRGSRLARWQAEWVAEKLGQRGVQTELVIVKTLGDVRSGPIANVGAQGVFTKEIQNHLLADEIDLAVHSLKDLPSDSTERLTLACVPARERSGDALVARVVKSIDELPEGATVGTGSARRRAQLLAYRRDLHVCEMRGNIDTRLSKLDEGELDAIVLAEAGLHRLELQNRITQILPRSIMLPAVGQGALGLEAREDDDRTRAAVRDLHDVETFQAVLAERALLRTLRGGCIAPIGAWAESEADQLRLHAIVLNADGTDSVEATSVGPASECEELGIRTGNELLAQGADALLDSARSP